MTLTLGPVLRSAGIDPADAQAIRHAFVREHEDSGLPGIHADSTDDEILEYTRRQSAKPRVFPADPPRLWVVFVREGGDRAASGPWSRTAAKSPTTANCAPSTSSSPSTWQTCGVGSSSAGDPLAPGV